MHIAIASHHRLPVTGYGGTERVVVALVRGLVALGHRVTLIAATGTRVPEAHVVETPPKRLRDPTIDLVTLCPADTDVLHPLPRAAAPERATVSPNDSRQPEG